MKAKTLSELVAELTLLLPEHGDKLVDMEGCDCDGTAGEVRAPKPGATGYVDRVYICRSEEYQ